MSLLLLAAAPRRAFSCATILRSNIGRKPVVFDNSKVSIVIAGQHNRPPAYAGQPPKTYIDPRKPFSVQVNGPLGSLVGAFPPFVHLDLQQSVITKQQRTSRLSQERALSSAGAAKTTAVAAPTETATADAAQQPETENVVAVSVEFPGLGKQRAMWGTARVLLQNMVKGVTQGHTVKIRLVGVGFRAAMDTQRNVLQLKLGFANTVEMPVPEYVIVTIVSPDELRLQGPDKNIVTQFAASIRRWRKPEPYNQKGIFVDDETITKKKGKKR
ncbi:54S ribosomal protein L6 mitochondrial [Sorochytrium milnesiophthora]